MVLHLQLTGVSVAAWSVWVPQLGELQLLPVQASCEVCVACGQDWECVTSKIMKGRLGRVYGPLVGLAAYSASW